MKTTIWVATLSLVIRELLQAVAMMSCRRKCLAKQSTKMELLCITESFMTEMIHSILYQIATKRVFVTQQNTMFHLKTDLTELLIKS